MLERALTILESKDFSFRLSKWLGWEAKLEFTGFSIEIPDIQFGLRK